MTKIAIIGGGAAGMMVAASLLERDNWAGEILLFEKNAKLGAKVLISGGGRCNFTIGIFKRNELKGYYTRGWDFLEFSMKKFGPKKVRKWFESHGVPCKEEDDYRVFPVSDKGEDVVNVFGRLFKMWGKGLSKREELEELEKLEGLEKKKGEKKERSIDIRFNEGVKHIERTDTGDGFVITTGKSKYFVDKVVITTGGNAFAHTGSSGDGYAFARALGHTITPLGPSLNSFVTREKWLHNLSGLSFQEAKIKGVLSDGAQISSIGPVLLTHFGISGPNTFSLASKTAFESIDSEHPFRVLLQPLSSKDYAGWNTLFLEAGNDSPKKELHTVLGKYLTRRFVENLLAELGIRFHLKMAELSKRDRQLLSKYLGEGIPLHLVKRRPGDEFVTAGGVDTSGINPKTLESTICPGLYFAGEVVNVDGVTGGFNLQACRAMGKTVGEGIV